MVATNRCTTGWAAEFRRKVLDLVEAGRPVAEIADQLGVTGQTIYNWRNQDLVDSGLQPGVRTAESVGAWTGWPATLRGERYAPRVLTQRPHPRRDVVDAPEDFVECARQVECDYVKLFARVFDTV